MKTATATDAEASEVLCSKCKVNERADADSTNPWCQPCKTKYQKEYMDMMKSRTSEQAFTRGVASFRSYLVGEFERLGSGTFSGYEIAELIANAQRPVEKKL